MARTIPDLLRARAADAPSARFVTADGADVSYGEAFERARDAAAALAWAGAGRGDRVALMLPNGQAFLDLWFGTALLGAVVVPINTALRGEGLAHVLTHCAASVLVVDERSAMACTAAVTTGDLPDRRFAFGGAAGWPDAQEWLSGGHGRAAEPRLEPGEPASILYTSGTTGPAKGVVNAHAAYVTTGRQFAFSTVRARPDDVLYTTLPLFHVNAQMLSVMGSLTAGVPLVLGGRFSASGFLDDVRRHGATVFNYIGAMLSMIAAQPARADDADTRLRLAVGGAAPAGLWQAFERRYGLTILEMYGLTETATVCVGNPPEDIRVGRIGKGLDWAEVDVRRADGTSAADGEDGEIVVRSDRPHVLFSCYFKDELATRRAMHGGWFHTGDCGRRDEDGYLTFVSRLKDVIRRRGENISPVEIERVLLTHPGVAECAVVGVPSPLGEEDVMAVVVPDGDAPDPTALVEHCRGALAAFMVPRYVRLVDALPRTETERVQKYRLRSPDAVTAAWDAEASEPRVPQ